MNENNLKQVYNDYRKAKGMEPVDFVKNPHDPISIQHCMDFLLKCVKDQPAGAELDAFKGSLFDGMGVNSHNSKQFRDDELQITSKKKFENNQHALSKGFKDLCIPSNVALVEQEHRDLLRESDAFKYRERVASLNRSPASSTTREPLEPAGYRVPKPFKRT